MSNKDCSLWIHFFVLHLPIHACRFYNINMLLLIYRAIVFHWVNVQVLNFHQKVKVMDTIINLNIKI